MTPETFLSTVLVPGLTWMTSIVGPKPGLTVDWQDDAPARLLLCTIAGQESAWENVQQGGDGPGRGYFQFEPETCGELLVNSVSHAMMFKVCAALKIEATETVVYGALLADPKLQVAMARFDLWCDRAPLPAYGDEMAAWETYLRIWRPGKPSLERWSGNYLAALTADQTWSKTA
jgi:hypothetical protein